MLQGLKITIIANNVIFDSAWIAGVDYDDFLNYEEYDEEEDTNDEKNDDADEYK